MSQLSEWADRLWAAHIRPEDPVPHELETRGSVKLVMVKPMRWLDHVNTPTAVPVYIVWQNDRVTYTGTDYRTAYKVWERTVDAVKA